MFQIKLMKQVGIGIVLALSAFILSFLISKWIHSPLKKEGVKIYYAENISEAHAVIINKFNDLHKGQIEVVPVNLPFSKFSTNERKELLARALRSQSDKLDVFAVDVIWVPRFAKWSEALNNYFPDIDRLGLLPEVLKTAIYDSSLMALPLYTDLMHLYYRKDLIRKIKNHESVTEKLKQGITWEELSYFFSPLKKQNNNIFIFPGKNFEGLMCMFFSNLYSQGVAFSNNQFSVKNGYKFSNAINVLSSLIYSTKISPIQVVHMDEHEGYNYSLENNGIIFVGWPGLIEQNKERLKTLGLSDQIGMAPLPRFSGGETVSIIGGWNLMISKNSEHKEEAATFLRFTVLEENQRLLNDLSGFIPVYHGLFKDPKVLASKPNLKFYNDLAEKSRSRPMHEQYTQISDIYSYYLNLVLKKEMNAEEALKQVESELNVLNIGIE